MPQRDNNLNTNDHDVLVGLKTSFDIFLRQYNLDMTELKNGTAQQLANHDLRIVTLEKIVEQVRPIETVAEFRVVQKKIDNWVTSANVFRIMAGVIGGLIVFILTQVPGILKTWGML